MGDSPVGVRVRDVVPRFHSVQHGATTGNSSDLPTLGLVALHPVAGSWTGRLDLPGAPLDIGVTLAGTPEALIGTLDVPAQGVAGLPLADVAVDGATVRFAVRYPGCPATYRSRAP
jgi:hypothetical protein